VFQGFIPVPTATETARVQKHQNKWLPLAAALLTSLLSWLLVFLLIPPPAQRFPLIDDWAFARGLFYWLRGGGIRYLQWASMPLLGQWMWAAPWVWIFGDDLAALRVSTIVLSWLGLGAFYDLLRQAEIERGAAGFVTAVLAFNPLFFLLQGTFMTDVPSLSFSLISLALYCRGLQRSRLSFYMAGAIFALLAVTTRPNTVTVPLISAMLLAGRPGPRRKALWWLLAFGPVLAGAAIYGWFRFRDDIRPLGIAWPETQTVFGISLGIAEMAGLAVLPLFVLDPHPGAPKAFAISLAVLVPTALYWWRNAAFVVYCGLFPTVDGVISVYGVYSAHQYVGQRPVLLEEPMRLVLTILGCIGAAFLAARMLNKCSSYWARRADDNASPVVPLLLMSVLQLPFVLAPERVYDRYFLPLLPGALYLAAPLAAGIRWKSWAAFAVLGGFALVCVSLTHDWLAWNSARWELGRKAVGEGIDARDIEGGLEWDGWYSPGLRLSAPEQPQGLANPLTQSYFPHLTGRYALAFSQVPRSVIVGKQAYSQWLPPGERHFLLLRDVDEP
jgi:hypothetical protein